MRAMAKEVDPAASAEQRALVVLVHLHLDVLEEGRALRTQVHDDVEDRAARGCLMNLVDDATGRTLARLGDQETIWAAERMAPRNAYLELEAQPARITP